MSEQAATPPAPSTAPPPSSTGGKASGGMRALGLLGALVIAFAAAVMIVLGGDLADSPICKDVAQTPLGPLEDCYDMGSSAIKSASEIFAYGAGVIGIIAALIGLAFTITGRRGRLFVRAAGLAVAVGALSFVIAQF